ncbi:MAG: SurA N-terminal domain-containing protein [Candidatus Saccharimonadales bacterium]
MKKLSLKKKTVKKQVIPSRITNETVAEHRERILAGGRRFKYPMQYARHRLVITTVIISIAAIALATFIGWWQLYPAQNTSTFMYRVTRVLPLPVASVDNYSVRYSDYLMYYNGSAHWLRKNEKINFSSKDGQLQNNFIKRKSMDIAIASAYAHKIATERGISVSYDRINAEADAARNTASGRISQEAYDASVLSTLGWTQSEYRQYIKNRLLLQDVSFAVDDTATKHKQLIADAIASGVTDLDTLVAAVKADERTKPTVATSGLVPIKNDDGGLAKQASQLEKGQISQPIRTSSGDGYYFVKLLEKSKTQVNYSYVRVPLTAFDNRLDELRRTGKITEYISIIASDQQQAPATNEQSQ